MDTPEPDRAYEPPVITDLGTLAELTRGDSGGSEDGLSGFDGDVGSGGF